MLFWNACYHAHNEIAELIFEIDSECVSGYTASDGTTAALLAFVHEMDICEKINDKSLESACSSEYQVDYQVDVPLFNDDVELDSKVPVKFDRFGSEKLMLPLSKISELILGDLCPLKHVRKEGMNPVLLGKITLSDCESDCKK